MGRGGPISGEANDRGREPPCFNAAWGHPPRARRRERGEETGRRAGSAPGENAPGFPPANPTPGSGQVFRFARSTRSTPACSARRPSCGPGSIPGRSSARLDQSIPAVILDALRMRRPGSDMVDRLAARTGAAAAQPGHNFFKRQLVAQDGVQGHAALGQQFLQGLGLVQLPCGESRRAGNRLGSAGIRRVPARWTPPGSHRPVRPGMASRAVFRAGLGSLWHWAARKRSPVDR